MNPAGATFAMAERPKVLAFVMAGGTGSRLHPLTAGRCKPAVPFGTRHRVVDFVLSNLVNSDILSIHLLVQYQSQSLIEHVRRAWVLPSWRPDQFINVVPPQMRHGPRWFQGTADAVAQNLHLIEAARPDFVAVFGADHVYRMDVRQMLAFHVATQADVSVATLPVPREQCRAFGIVRTDPRSRITDFKEKPATTAGLPGRPGHALASMGNYIFSADVLLKELRCARDSGETDFGGHMLPRMLRSHRLVAYDFAGQQVPGVAPFEEPAYWRDVGTVDAYFGAHLDTLGLRPSLRIGNPQWPIHAGADLAEPAYIEAGRIARSAVGAGCCIDDAELDQAVLRPGATVQADARLDRCIVMEGTVVGRGASLRRVIVDQDNHIPPGTRIGHDPVEDRRRFPVSDSGIVVVPQGHFAAAQVLRLPLPGAQAPARPAPQVLPLRESFG
jgi:glucose-1-phosphate adenylyltransferase